MVFENFQNDANSSLRVQLTHKIFHINKMQRFGVNHAQQAMNNALNNDSEESRGTVVLAGVDCCQNILKGKNKYHVFLLYF